MGQKSSRETNVFDPSKVVLQPSMGAGVYQRRTNVATQAPKVGAAQQVVKMKATESTNQETNVKCFPSHLEGSIEVVPAEAQRFLNAPLGTATEVPSHFSVNLNRWCNIYPHDTNRVYLSLPGSHPTDTSRKEDAQSDAQHPRPDDSANGSESGHANVDGSSVDVATTAGAGYVNASWVRGFGTLKGCEYIAAEVPVQRTVNDFHRMVCEQAVSFVVLLVDDDAELSGLQYWPSQAGCSATHGELEVTLVAEDRMQGAFSKVVLSYKSLSTEKVVHTTSLYVFSGWPTSSVPCNAEKKVHPRPLLELMLTLRADRNQFDRRQSPLLVHCQDGISRTGAFIVIDQIIDCIEAGERVDVLSLIQRVREDRMAMVNSTALFRFVHEAALQYSSYHLSIHKETPGIVYSLPRVAAAPQQQQRRRPSSSPSASASQALRLVSHDQPPPSQKLIKTFIPPEKTSRFVLHKLETGHVVFVLDNLNTVPQAVDAADEVVLIPETFSPEAFSRVKKGLEVASASLERSAFFKTHFSKTQVMTLLRKLPSGSYILGQSGEDPSKHTIGVKHGQECIVLPIRRFESQRGDTYFRMEQSSRQFETVQDAVAAIIDDRRAQQQQQQQQQTGSNKQGREDGSLDSDNELDGAEEDKGYASGTGRRFTLTLKGTGEKKGSIGLPTHPETDTGTKGELLTEQGSVHDSGDTTEA